MVPYFTKTVLQVITVFLQIVTLHGKLTPDKFKVEGKGAGTGTRRQM